MHHLIKAAGTEEHCQTQRLLDVPRAGIIPCLYHGSSQRGQLTLRCHCVAAVQTDRGPVSVTKAKASILTQEVLTLGCGSFPHKNLSFGHGRVFSEVQQLCVGNLAASVSVQCECQYMAWHCFQKKSPWHLAHAGQTATAQCHCLDMLKIGDGFESMTHNWRSLCLLVLGFQNIHSSLWSAILPAFDLIWLTLFYWALPSPQATKDQFHCEVP